MSEMPHKTHIDRAIKSIEDYEDSDAKKSLRIFCQFYNRKELITSDC